MTAENWIDDARLKPANDAITLTAREQGFHRQVWFTQHLNGVPWNEAPLPGRWHHCEPQTRDSGIVRCACGAIGRLVRWGKLGWEYRNSRRRGVDALTNEPLPG